MRIKRFFVQEECLLYPILQKYYNALKHLVELNTQQDLFENIAKVDSFFSEFRSITFVMQKIFSTPEKKKYYEKLRDKYLINDLMKWFNDSRVEVVHSSPFALEKSLLVDVFFPDKKFTVIKDRFTVDNELPFSTLEITIKEFLQRITKLSEVYFTISLKFCEKDKEINIYYQIISGIKQMQSFLEELQSDYPCQCRKCNLIKEKMIDVYHEVLLKPICFVWDCMLINNKISYGTQAIIIPQGISPNIKSILSERYSLKKTKIYSNYTNINSLFKQITLMHTYMYINQSCHIIPTFFLIYDDETFSTLLFEGTNKTTFYRIVSNITEICQNNNVKAVIYIGEYSYYSIKDLKKAKGSLEERKRSSEKTLFCCSLITKNTNKTILLESKKIDNSSYIKTQIENPVKDIDFIWLNPIKNALNENHNKGLI